MTLACLIFVELTLLFKIVFRAGAIIGIKSESEYASIGLEQYLIENRSNSALVCVYDLAYIFAMMFFTVALFLNAIRWVELISNLKIKEGKHSISKLKKVFIGSIVVRLGIVSVYRMVCECSVKPQNDVV